MKPGFALSLSPDGISLLHRAAGGWRLIGKVPLNTSDLGAALAKLRAQAEQLDPAPIFSKLIIPNDQIRYLTLDTGMVDDSIRIDLARAALDGATPYAVDELAFDLSQDGPLTHVAAVAIETLEEAESFADSHGFGPTSFVAAPGDETFLGEPFFGTARSIRGTEIEPDGIAVVNIGPAEIPETLPKTDPSPPVAKKPEQTPSKAEPPEPDAADQQIKVDQTDQNPPNENQPIAIAGFSSRRHKASNGNPVLNGASRTSPATDISGAALPLTPLQPDETDPVWPKETTQQALIADISASALKTKSEPSAPATPAQTLAPSVTAAETPASSKNFFSSRRQDIPPQDNETQAGKPIGISAAPEKVAAPSGSASHAFSMRAPLDIGGKPRFLGPALVAALLIFMAAVAGWAFYFNPTWFTFGQQLDVEETSTVTLPLNDGTPQKLPQPDPLVPIPTVETTSDQLPEIIEPQVSALPEHLTYQPPPEDGQTLGPTSTDIAVLDALQLPLTTDQDLQPPPGASTNDQAETQPELSQAAQYAAVGIWQSIPDIPEIPAETGLNDLYVASIDNTNLSQDAVALPRSDSFATDVELDSITSPTAAGSAFDLDERGLVRATPEGAMNPDGVMVFLGRPNRVPPPTPNRPDPKAEAQISEQHAVLARLRPRARPDDLVEQAERANLGGLSLAELGQKRPRLRPASSRPANEDSLPTTDQAISISVVPKSRPVNFANLVDRAQRNTNNTAPALASASASTAGILIQPTTVEPETVTPSIPTSASVARQATMENSINLRKVNLIGVYGTSANRRALVRLSSGRYKKVKVGDRFDGGQVIAIGDAELRYQKGGRNVTLKIPNG